MAKKLYSIKQRRDIEEYHIFVSENETETGKCFLEDTSICGKMEYSTKAKSIMLCKTEKEVRLKAAEIGRHVCGECVRTLYTTYV